MPTYMWKYSGSSPFEMDPEYFLNYSEHVTFILSLLPMSIKLCLNFINLLNIFP